MGALLFLGGKPTVAYINCKGFDGVALDILKNIFSPLLEVTQPFEIHEENANMFVFLETVVLKVQEQLLWIIKHSLFFAGS